MVRIRASKSFFESDCKGTLFFLTCKLFLKKNEDLAAFSCNKTFLNIVTFFSDSRNEVSKHQTSLERYTEFETEVVQTFDIIAVVLICRIAVVSSYLEADVLLVEREECHTDLRRDVESPVVMSVDES